MHKIIGFAALSVALAFGPGPAAADKQTRQIVAGALLLGVLGLAIDQQRQEREREDAVQATRQIFPQAPIPRPQVRLEPLTTPYPDRSTAGGILTLPPRDVITYSPEGQVVLRPLDEEGARPWEAPVTAPPPTGPITVRPLTEGGVTQTVGGLPGRCLQNFDDRGDTIQLYNADCLTDSFADAGSLPLSCAVTVQSLGRFSSGYDPVCLGNAGYRSAG